MAENKENARGERIAKLRESQGLTQAAFAVEIGHSQGRQSEWERGTIIPSAEGYVKLAVQAAKTDPKEAVFFWGLAGVPEDAITSVADTLYKEGVAQRPVVIPPYKDSVCLPFEISLPAPLVSKRVSTFYLVVETSGPFGRIGPGVAPGDIIIFERCEPSSYKEHIGEKVLVQFKDNLRIGRLAYVGHEGGGHHLILGSADDFPSNLQAGTSRVISTFGERPLQVRDFHRPEESQLLGIWIAQFSMGAPELWKRMARLQGPKE